MRFVPSGLFALTVMAVSLPAHAETTAEAVVAACTPAAPAVESAPLEEATPEEDAVPSGPYGGYGAPQVIQITPPADEPQTIQLTPTVPDYQGKQPRGENTLIPAHARSVMGETEVALALPPRFLSGVRRVAIEATRVAEEGGGGSSSGVSDACSAAITAYVEELRTLPGATDASIDAGLATLVYELATTNIPTGGGSALSAAILLVASESKNGNLKYNAEKLANDIKDDKLDTKLDKSSGLNSASLS